MIIQLSPNRAACFPCFLSPRKGAAFHVAWFAATAHTELAQVRAAIGAQSPVLPSHLSSSWTWKSVHQGSRSSFRNLPWVGRAQKEHGLRRALWRALSRPWVLGPSQSGVRHLVQSFLRSPGRSYEERAWFGCDLGEWDSAPSTLRFYHNSKLSLNTSFHCKVCSQI